LHRNCLLRHVIKGKIEGRTEVRGRRRKKSLDNFEEKRVYGELKEEALDHSVEKSLWKRLWICRKANQGMNEQMYNFYSNNKAFKSYFETNYNFETVILPNTTFVIESRFQRTLQTYMFLV
jgi:hypothetical protein